jgi:misacylated tRNA(Ala) deacylase
MPQTPDRAGPALPAPLPAEIFTVDAYCRAFDATVADVDPDAGRVVLDRTAFYPGGGGQPHDVGTLSWAGPATPSEVVRVGRENGRVWHWLDGPDLPPAGTGVHAEIDWGRRHLLMRTHTALHVLCGVMWADYRVAVTGGNMEPGEGRLDFELDGISAEFGQRVQARVNEEIARGLDIRVDFVGRAAADADPALVRTKATMIPRVVDPLRVIDIVGLDRQADGGTHVANTAEVGHVVVVKTESKGRANKRIRIRLE